MPTYQYQALQADGSLTQGLLHDASLDSAMQKLMGQGLQVQSIGVAAAAGDPLAAPVRQVSVERPLVNESIPGVHADARGATYTEQSVDYAPNAEMGGYSGHEGVGGPPTGQRNYVATSVVGPLVGKITLTNLSFFYTQLATMLKAGVPMVQSLDTLSKQARDPRFANILREIRGHVEAGRPMTAGMQRYPEAFSPVMLSIIRTGEEGGFLDEALETVAKYTDDEIEIRNLYRRVTIYPKLLIFASIVVILGANAIIGSINNQAGKLSSPLTTASTWYWLAPLIIVLFLFFRVGLANFRVKYLWDMVLSYIPFVGGTVRQMAMAKFGRAFGALYRAGVPLQRVIPLSADSCGNEYMRAKIYPAGKVLESGAGVTETLKATGALSPIVIDMLSTGERTGNLDHMLNKMADYYHDEAKTKSVQLGYFTGVLVLLIVSAYIGSIIVNFYQNYGRGFTDIMK